MFNFVEKILSINQDFSFIGEQAVFSVETPLRGWMNFDDIQLTDNSTGTKFFDIEYRYANDGCNYSDWQPLSGSHVRFTDTSSGVYIQDYELIEGWDTFNQPTLFCGNRFTTLLNIFQTQFDLDFGGVPLAKVDLTKTYPTPLPSPADVVDLPFTQTIVLDGEIFVQQYDLHLAPINSIKFNVTHNKLVSIPIKNDFIVEVRVTRAGTDGTGALSLQDISLTGTYSTEYFELLDFNGTAFKDITWGDERWNKIWLNLFKKYYKLGIIPEFVERDETKFGETVDEDYVDWWKTACYFWALQIELGIRKLEEIRDDKVDLTDFLEQRTSLICPDLDLEMFQYVEQFFLDEMSQRGTHNIHLKKDFNGVESGDDASDIFISEYLNYGTGVYVVEISNFSGEDVSLTPYDLERDNADGNFVVIYDLGQFGILKQGESLVLSSVWIPQQDKVVLATESTILSGLTGTTQLRISKNSIPIDHLGDKTIIGWGTDRKFIRASNSFVLVDTNYNPLTSPIWGWTNEVPPVGTVSTNDVVFTTFGSHVVVFGKTITGGKPIHGELLRYICFQDCDEFLFEYLPRHLCGWNMNNSSPIFKGVTGRYQLNKTPDTTADVNNFEKWCFINGDFVEWLESDGLGILLTEAGDNLVTEVGSSEKILEKFYFERDSFLINPVAGDTGICHTMCVNTLLSYELTFWVRFDSVPTAALNVVFKAFQDNVPKELQTINTLVAATEISIITDATLLLPEKYYFVRCVVYNWEAPTLIAAEAKTNIDVGENVRFLDREIDKLEFQIFRSNAGAGAGMRLWNVKFSPLKLDKSSVYVNTFNVNNVILQNRNGKILRKELGENVVRYLLPYGAVFQPQYLDLLEELEIGFLLQEDSSLLLQETLDKLIVTVN